MDQRDLQPNERDDAVLRARADLAAQTLAPLPDAFSRLVYLASLREYSSDEYSHWGLEDLHGREAARRALREEHLAVFREVNALPLPELARQAGAFVAGRAGDGKILLQNWTRDQSYNLLAPVGVSELERESFRINFAAVLAALARPR
ncbi:MAG TPA: hypothetical protein PKN61_11035 [Acidobacteriota bacterium]|nr:hypothetical protein [Acidobacteriota bacterium]HNR39560.1 hypothetical protein [Acidobacteriota bacterium]HNU00239.1 hypothetical protein [Acidobacteriota bacterium]HPB29034.1 hypothetical protein [Acidobacteriota bacterium]HQP74845.1 hypothetical protein [Acidobacteriota bacterium]